MEIEIGIEVKRDFTLALSENLKSERKKSRLKQNSDALGSMIRCIKEGLKDLVY